jgi:ABC-2 type transport system permease protein
MNGSVNDNFQTHGPNNGAAKNNSAMNGSPRILPASLMERIRVIRHLIRKEFIQIVRNRQNFRLLVMAPLLQLVIFGYASRLDVKDVATVVVDMDNSAQSREVVDAFSRSGYFIIKKMLPRYEDVDPYLLKGDAKMAILIPPDFERRIQGNRTAQVGILIDGVDTTTAGTVSGYAQSILQRVSQDILTDRTNKMQGNLYQSDTPRLIVPEVKDAGRAWFNPNLNSKEFFVPGVIVLILLAHTIILTSSVLVREKEMGTIEQLMVAPISRLELIVGKVLPCFAIEMITLSVITPLALEIFNIPFRGSALFFVATTMLFMMTSSAIGITISAFCTTQQQAVLTSFMFLQPSVLLSGYIFPIENMPEIVQYSTYLNPLRYFMTVVRGVFLKGTGWDVLWPQLIPILLMGIFYMWLAAVLFKRRMD